MTKYTTLEVSEEDLEDLIRRHPDNIENDLRYVDQQMPAGKRRLDLLMVDSSNTLVIAELKVVEDDAMLTQAMDYYDYIYRNVEGLARAYSKFDIDPGKDPRLFLVAPSFSIPVRERCKWIDIPISLFTFQCLEFEDRKGEVVPVFAEVAIPPFPERVAVYTVEERLAYIEEPVWRNQVKDLLDQVRHWDPDRITVKATKYDISLKVSGKLFGYIYPRKKFFGVGTWDTQDNWTTHQVKNQEQLQQVTELLKNNLELVKADYGLTST